MRFLAKLDKSIQFLLSICVGFFLLRIPSLFEPYWYGDEAIYQVMARCMNSGRILFSQVWDNKPPLLYILYAFYDGNQFSIRFVSLLFGLASVVFLFFLSQKLFTKNRAVYITTTIFAILFGLPLIEGNIANAENFFILPVLIGMYLLITHSNPLPQRIKSETKKHTSLLLSGTILGIAFLFKIVTVFDFAAALVIVFFLQNAATNSLSQIVQTVLFHKKQYIQLIAGFLLPLGISLLYFLMRGALTDYLAASFSGNVGYVGYNNAFIIPQGLLFIKMMLLGMFITSLFVFRKKLPQGLQILLIWLAFSVFSTFFAQRPYPHYLIVLLPALSLLIGSMYEFATLKKQLALITAAVLLLILCVFRIDKYKEPFTYYANFLAYASHLKSTESYHNYFDGNTNNWYDIADYIKLHTNRNDIIFVWANSPQIYYLSETLPPGRYVVGYHIAYNKEHEDETKRAMEKNPPKYLVISDDFPYYPFSLVGYRYKATIADSEIYEKVY